MTRRIPPLERTDDLDALLPRGICDRLITQYSGVFDQRHLLRHVLNALGLDAAMPRVRMVHRHAPDGARFLDVCAGYGSFASFLARSTSGLVVGVEIEATEVAFASK